MDSKSFRDYDQNVFHSYQVTVPTQETSYDRSKEECCNVMIDSFSFIKRLPAASSFLNILTTLVSVTSAYFGRELVLNRKWKQDKQNYGSSLPKESSAESELVNSYRKEGSPSSHRSDDSNHDNSHDNHNSSSPRARKFPHSASPQLFPREPHPVPHPPRPAPHSAHPAPLGSASQNSNHSSHVATSQEHLSRPTIHRPNTDYRHSRTPPNHDTVSEHHNNQVAVVQEHLQSHIAILGTPAVTGSGYDYDDLVTVAAECLHAQDYGRMQRVLIDIPLDSVDQEMALVVTFGLGQASFKIKHHTQAESYFTSLDSRARALGERGKGDVSIANYYRGEILYLRSKYDEASRHYKLAIDYHSTRVIVAKAFRVIPPTRSGLWAKLAASLRNGSRVVDAITAYQEAIATGTAKKDQLAAHTSLGNLLQNAGDNSQAVEHYTASIRLSEELGDMVSLGWAHGNIGNAYLGLNHRDKAIYHLKMALELTLEHEPTPLAIGRAYNNLGTAYQALNELDQAQEYYDLSLAQAIYGGDQAGQARVYGNIGNLQMLQKKYDGSIAHYTETLNTTKDKMTKITAYHNRGCARYEKAESEKRKHYVTKFLSSGLSAITSSAAATEREAEKLYTLTFHGDVMEGALEDEHRLPTLPTTVKKRYQKAMEDLSLVVDQHEKSFKHIKGSRSGLTLSVSLFETNSRTFHRLLDCHYNIGEWEKALVLAEQSRARTLGELLLQRKRGQLEIEFDTPLDLKDIDTIVGSQSHDVVAISYTGSRLLVWVLSPEEGDEGLGGRRKVRKAMFQVTLEEKGFEDKSLDYYLHYLLSEELVEKNVEMYAYIDYQTNNLVQPIIRLHELFAKPLLRVLSCLHPKQIPGHVREIVVVPDSYLNLLPLVALFDKTAQRFLVDGYRFRIMPSLLSMGVVDQMPPVVVQIPQEGNKFCVVGNPNIPTFEIKGKTWSLGKLPFATEEAEWVSYILGCKPTLHEQATKSVVMMMITSARMIHIATHGSAASGFLAFSSLDHVSDPVDESSVLIYPDDIEKMVIAPALVVLSSCDSGRGTVKADGILGMARAFILAGAQAVMTTMWRVPDESAAVFMKFFYQYLVDGHPASIALQKAILSIRSFSKYSGFVHWSGYQLTGREVMVVSAEREERERAVVEAMGGGGPTVFPRLDVVQLLEKELVEKGKEESNPPPTDVQVVHGSYGLRPAGPVRDFILRNHAFFTGGIYWLNGTTTDCLNGGLELVKAASAQESVDHALVVLEGITSLPKSDNLHQLISNRTTGIIIVSHASQPPESLRKEINQQLIRGWSPITIQPLSSVHTTQRIVHSIMSHAHFTPLNREQRLLEKIASLTSGCPRLIQLTNSLLQRCVEEAENKEDKSEVDFLDLFNSRVPLLSDTPTPLVDPSPSLMPPGDVTMVRSRAGSFVTNSYTSELITAFQLPPAHEFVLRTLSVFTPLPIPLSVVDIVQRLVVKATQGSTGPGRGAPNSITNLLSTRLLCSYPSPIICGPNHKSPSSSHSPPLLRQEKYIFVPQLVQDALWDQMEDTDVVFTITTAYKAVLEFVQRPEVSDSDLCFATGLAEMVVGKCDSSRSCIDDQVYKQAYKLLVSLQLRRIDQSTQQGSPTEKNNS